MTAAASAVDQILQTLADPTTAAPDPTRRASLSTGAAGIALLYVEHAHDDPESWPRVHQWLQHATTGGLHIDRFTGAVHGPPALWFVIQAAEAGSRRYQRANSTLADATIALTRDRLRHTHARIDSGEPGSFHEFDVISGLTGLGALHLHHHPNHPVTAEILRYLVRLTEPLGPDRLPGWWANHSPVLDKPNMCPGGHGNLGLAHGISGPLALLSTARRRSVLVDGQIHAITRICDWLDHWQQNASTGAWWPGHVDLDETRQHRTNQPDARSPSWCYGTPGIARAQQLAGIACNDHQRQRMAENAIRACLRDPTQRVRLTNPGLCHGTGGLLHAAWRMSQDALTGELAEHLPELVDLVIAQVNTDSWPRDLFNGTTGAALALRTTMLGHTSAAWDTPFLMA